VASSDTAVSLIAGFAIFPIVFGFGLDPAGGGGLFFQTMPVAFGQMPGGAIIGGMFFTLALFAAFTSSISLFEVGVSWLEDHKSIGRVKGAILLGMIMIGLGAIYVFSLDRIDDMDFITGQIMLPLGGILMSIFAGWVLSRASLADEIGSNALLMFYLRNLLRFVVPVALAFILVFGALDTLQNNYGWQLPQVLVQLLGPNG
jgi:neurotransmitter:Na+ symporter, NSS family